MAEWLGDSLQSCSMQVRILSTSPFFLTFLTRDSVMKLSYLRARIINAVEAWGVKGTAYENSWQGEIISKEYREYLRHLEEDTLSAREKISRIIIRILAFLFYSLPWFPRNFISYFNTRFVTKSHCLKTGLKRGIDHELDDRILHGLFNELVEYVEVDLAVMLRFCFPEEHTIPRWRTYWALSYLFPVRNPELGLKFIELSTKIHDGTEEDLFPWDKRDREVKNKVKELYLWWTEERPRESKALNDMHKRVWEDYDKRPSDEEREEFDNLYNKLDRKDTEMLIALIEIRHDLLI